MSLLKWAIFGLLMLPFVEIALFVAVALKVGVLAALALTILTSLAGMAVIRHAGWNAVTRTRGAFGDGVITRAELDGAGVLTVLGGVLLVIPGFLTDAIGLVLLLPPVQSYIRATLRRAVARAEGAAGQPGGPPGVVDLEPGQWRQVPEERIGHRPNPGRVNPGPE
jgi:UPF0716 protein FxsA